jgi:penicillin amidase
MANLPRRLAIAAVSLALLAPAAARPAVTAAFDGARAVNVVPPGESGNINLITFARATAGLGGYGPHFADQAALYSSFRYKAMLFGGGTLWHSLPGSQIYRDSFGIPKIYGADEPGLYRGFGYAMAADRLFQMDLFRRAGHGTLAALLGEAYVPMDEEVRTLSEGAAARAAELAAATPRIKTDAQAFVDGVNTYINEVKLNPLKIPAEFVLLADLPIKPWTIDDSLAFGEYAGRFFGEFGHGELEMAAARARLEARYSAATARKIFDDVFPADDPSAPTTIPASVGIFPRHVGTSGSGGPGPINASLASMGGAAAVARAAAARAPVEAALAKIQHRLGLDGFGSNQYVVDGAHSADGNSLLVSEPQTSIAAPSFFWEVELHGGGFDLRGVTVPGLAFVPIGRNQDSAWAVTSALDANSDTYAERLNAAGTQYFHGGSFHPVAVHSETIACHTPPTALLSLPDTSAVCTAPSRTITVRRTVHGPLITAPDHGVAYARQSVVDGRIISSLDAWTRATQARTVADFSAASSGVAFGFNFDYADAAGHAAYFHVGRYPIRPSDVDSRFPIPGTGPWDWQGFEAFADQPHGADPPGGFFANWNNKPAVGWFSKPTGSNTIPPAGPSRFAFTVWGPTHQVEPIQQDLAALGNQVTFLAMGRIERHVASIDNRARSFMPALIAAIDGSGDASLAQARSLLAAWNTRRIDANHDDSYDAPGLTIFDRWFEKVLPATFDELDARTFIVSSGVRGDGTFFSSDNEDTPSFKSDNGLYGTFAHALAGDARIDYFGGSSRDAVLVSALRSALASLATQYGSTDASTWHEKDEHEPYPAQGAGSVSPDVAPTLDRGSYGQIVEPGGAPQSGIFTLD